VACTSNVDELGFALERVDSYKYLGLILHAKLSWDLHYGAVQTKATLSSNAVQRFVGRAAPTVALLVQLCQAVILPVISYGFPFWRPDSSSGPNWEVLQSLVFTPVRSVGLAAVCPRQ
jgi:hypothetical protein